MTSNPGLLDLLSHQMLTRPAGRALVTPQGDVLDFGSLQRLSQQVGVALCESGLEGRTRLAVALDEPFAQAACIVAAMPRAAVVPLSAAAPPGERQRAVLETRCSALLVDEAAGAALAPWALAHGMALLGACEEPSRPGSLALRVITAAGASFPRDQASATPGGEADPVVLMLRTSGTTARPKLVPLTSAALGASALNVARQLELVPGDLSLNVMPMHHSHGIVGVLLSSMSAGASVAYLSRFDPARFFEAMHHHKPSWFSATPALHHALLDWRQSHPDVQTLPPLRFVRSTSAPMPVPMIERLEKAYGAPVVESFGMTEWSQIASNGIAGEQRRAGTVGRATGVAIALRDATGRIVDGASTEARSVSGELLIRGEGVSGVYEDDPQATSQAWCDGWFRTGDLARVDSHGFISITGRLKETVNRGGEKISPREIEDALLDHPAVRDAAAFGVPHPSLGEDLLAAVVLRPGHEATPAQLRDHLFIRMAEDRVPTEIRLVDALPRSETGKLARDRLTAFVLATPAAGSAPDRSRTMSDSQQRLCSLFADVLGRDAVAPDENFFRLGGDSLTGMRAVVRINQAFGIRLRPAALFRYPTVESLEGEVLRLMPPPPPADDLEGEFANLSDEEVARLLEAEERAGTGRS